MRNCESMIRPKVEISGKGNNIDRKEFSAQIFQFFEKELVISQIYFCELLYLGYKNMRI